MTKLDEVYKKKLNWDILPGPIWTRNNKMSEKNKPDVWVIVYYVIVIGGLSIAMILLATVLTMCALDPSLVPHF